MFRAIPTLLDDGTTKLCIEKEAFREELKYVYLSVDFNNNLMFSVSIYIFCFRKDPVLSCVHKSVEKCHYTYTTQFVPVTEEVVTTIILLKIFSTIKNI